MQDRETPVENPEISGLQGRRLVINREASFLKEGRIKSPNLMIAYDENGNKYLVKTSIYFTKNGRLLTLSEFLEEYPDYLNNIVEDLKNEERAYKLGQLIGIPQATTFFTTIDGIPFVAYRFIEGVRDIGFGSDPNIFAKDTELCSLQEYTLAVGALYKFLVGGFGDNGQYLQDPNGNIYSSDIHVCFPETDEMTEEDMLKEIYRYGPEGFFIPSIDNLRRQLNGMRNPKFLKILERLQRLKLEEIIQLLSENPNCPTDNEIRISEIFLDRAQKAIPIFRLLSQYPEEAIKIINPRERNGKQIYTQEESNKALNFFLQRLAESRK